MYFNYILFALHTLAMIKNKYLKGVLNQFFFNGFENFTPPHNIIGF